ncbi:MAG: GIY-YIG nuclease family protein [Candidatus Dojkabacteria bacterium]
MGYYLYILRCKDGSLYTGVAKDLEARLAQHRNGKGSKYVRSRLPFACVYSEQLQDKASALRREYEIKHMPKTKKEGLVSSIP